MLDTSSRTLFDAEQDAFRNTVRRVVATLDTDRHEREGIVEREAWLRAGEAGTGAMPAGEGTVTYMPPEQRAGDHRPQLSDLRESGAIEQDADLVMFIYRQEIYDGPTDKDGNSLEGRAEVIIGKQRNGPIGEVNLEWLRDFTRFQDPVSERHKDFDQFNDRQMVDPASGF